uniref:Uncharacterized protein n=1 Tax=Rhizophora mucronata TaxID=61149 RepID=A0A2P2NRT1_RHIMU
MGFSSEKPPGLSKRKLFHNACNLFTFLAVSFKYIYCVARRGVAILQKMVRLYAFTKLAK